MLTQRSERSRLELFSEVCADYLACFMRHLNSMPRLESLIEEKIFLRLERMDPNLFPAVNQFPKEHCGFF